MSNSFGNFGLAAPLEESLRQLNFSIPTPIQAQTLPVTLAGKNLVGCAQTGSGKTAAYCLPLIQRLMDNPNEMALILVPTRELVAQVSQVLGDLLKSVDGIRTVGLIGGESISQQMKMLKKKPFPRVIVATPGRLLDLIRRNAVYLKTISFLVLDEADRMLDMGFAPQLQKIDQKLPKKENRQTLMFSATMPKSVDNLVKRFICDETRVTIGQAKGECHHIRQSVVTVNPSTKNDQLLNELENTAGSVIIFLASKHRTDRLARFLAKSGHQISRIHGDRSQSQRTRAMRDFRSGKTPILVATDIAARGLDVPQIGTVINFDLPRAAEDYIHRIGRSGRAGEIGASITFVCREDRFQWNKIVKKYQLNIESERKAEKVERRSEPQETKDAKKPEQRDRRGRSDRRKKQDDGQKRSFRSRNENDRNRRGKRKDSKKRWGSKPETKTRSRDRDRASDQKNTDRGLIVSQSGSGLVLRESEKPFKPKFKSKSGGKGKRERSRTQHSDNFSRPHQRKNSRNRRFKAKRGDRLAVAV